MEAFLVLLNCLIIPVFGSKVPKFDFNKTSFNSLLGGNFRNGKSLDSLLNGIVKNGPPLSSLLGSNRTHDTPYALDLSPASYFTNGLFGGRPNDCSILSVKCGHNTTHMFCCSFGQTCCTDKDKGCCRRGYKCCPGSRCCPSYTNCCGRHCCGTSLDLGFPLTPNSDVLDQGSPLTPNSHAKWYVVVVGGLVGGIVLLTLFCVVMKCHGKAGNNVSGTPEWMNDEYRRRGMPKRVAITEH